MKKPFGNGGSLRDQARETLTRVSEAADDAGDTITIATAALMAVCLVSCVALVVACVALEGTRRG